ncbi:MAG: hypothetical protein PHD15_04180 [Clostridia bacterium]|nr:hypothetical protein [Clostridia bacterium]
MQNFGSDLKKPDAVTVLSYKNYKKIIYPLSVNMLLYVGNSTNNILERVGIYTIGDLAHYDKNKLVKLLGKLGETVYNYANGTDDEEVTCYTNMRVPKSISKGLTFKQDITNIKELENNIRILCDEVSSNLRKNNLKCTVVGLNIKDSFFVISNRQKKISKTNLFQDILKVAIELLKENYIQNKPIRAVTINVGNLINPNEESQMDIFSIGIDKSDNNKIENITKVLDCIRSKYGSKKITFGSLTNL